MHCEYIITVICNCNVNTQCREFKRITLSSGTTTISITSTTTPTSNTNRKTSMEVSFTEEVFRIRVETIELSHLHSVG